MENPTRLNLMNTISNTRNHTQNRFFPSLPLICTGRVSVRIYENKTIVAHNAMFDVGALCATLDHYGIEYPTFDYNGTVWLSQLAYPELPSHKLNVLSDALGIKFSHHHAYDDAYACAAVLLRNFDDYSLMSLDEIKECFEVESGRVYPRCHLSFKKKKRLQSAEKEAAKRVQNA